MIKFIHLKNGPGVEYDQISQLKQNQRVTVLKSKYHWMYVETDDEKNDLLVQGVCLD